MSYRNAGFGAAVIVALLATGYLTASNMAFKLNYALSGQGTGRNTIALPWVPLAGIDDAGDLLDHVNATGIPTGKAQRMEWWRPSGDFVVLYAGAGSDPPGFELRPGEGYWIKVGADVEYLIAGAHDPELEVTFQGTGSSATGTNFYAPPYHSALSDAGDLIDDINANGIPSDSVERLAYWLVASNSLLLYSGSATDPPGPPFVQGEAIFVKVGASDVVYRPSHY